VQHPKCVTLASQQLPAHPAAAAASTTLCSFEGGSLAVLAVALEQCGSSSDAVKDDASLLVAVLLQDVDGLRVDGAMAARLPFAPAGEGSGTDGA